MDKPRNISPFNPSYALPQSLVVLGQHAQKAFIDFFTAQIRNANICAVYYHNVSKFLKWMEKRGIGLQDLQAFLVALYIERLGMERSKSGSGYSIPTVKQHLAALRVFSSFLVVRQILPSNPASDVRGPKHVVTTGKTPVLAGIESKPLFASIDISTPPGLRDRAIIGVMVYTFA